MGSQTQLKYLFVVFPFIIKAKFFLVEYNHKNPCPNYRPGLVFKMLLHVPDPEIQRNSGQLCLWDKKKVK